MRLRPARKRDRPVHRSVRGATSRARSSALQQPPGIKCAASPGGTITYFIVALGAVNTLKARIRRPFCVWARGRGLQQDAQRRSSARITNTRRGKPPGELACFHEQRLRVRKKQRALRSMARKMWMHRSIRRGTCGRTGCDSCARLWPYYSFPTVNYDILCGGQFP